MAKPPKQNPLNKQNAAKRRLQFTMLSRLSKAMAKEYSLQGIFKLGYRNKEDISNNPPYVLSVGSQNVLTNAAEQVVIRNGYQYDGPAGTQNTYGVDSSFDFNTHSLGGTKNVRKWGGNLQVRYVNPVTNAVSWVTLLSSLNTGNVCNFDSFWDNSALRSLCLFVNGDLKIWKWTGAVASYASSTANTITVSGTPTLAQLNFDGAGNIVVDGVTYAYTSAGVISATTYTQNPTNNNIQITPSQWTSQSFTTGAAATQIQSASVMVHSNQTSAVTANIIAAIYTDNAGVPGTSVASQIGSIPASFSSGAFTVNFTFNQTILPATTYHLVVYLLSSDGAVTLAVQTGVSGGVGTNLSTNTGSTWAPQNGYLSAIITENDSNLLTFNGVSPAPSGIAVGDAIIQPPVVGTTAVTGLSGFTTFDLIKVQRNQVYYGSFTNNTVYVTKVNSFTDASFSTPRVVGEGVSVVLDSPPIALIPQDGGMYISAGKSEWYSTLFTLSSDLSKESFEINPLKTSAGQGAISQSYVGKLKNSVVFASNEVLINSLGSVKNILADPQVQNMSDSIKYDIDAYTFGGGSTHYINYFFYISVPRNNVVRVFNVNKKYWEAPQTMPVGMFYEVSGALYGHDAFTDASYQLFVPGSFNDVGNPISAIAAFPYNSSEGASPAQKKFFNKFYTEGYISANTTLSLEVNYDFGAFSGLFNDNISGADKKIIFNKITDGSLGRNSFGTQPIGTILNLPQLSAIPKFRKISTFAPINNYEFQIVYSSNGIDQNWALLRFGPAVGPARDVPVEITE